MNYILLTLWILAGLCGQAKADTVFIVNGKQTDAPSAAMAAMSKSNKVLKCDEVTMSTNGKGSLKLNKKNPNGDWTPISK